MGLIRQIHAWAGLFLSLVLAILGLSGALLVFKSDYVKATVIEARGALATDPATLGATLQSIQKNFANQGLVYVNLGGAERGVHLLELKNEKSAFINQNGDAVETWAKNGRLEDWVFDLHHHLLAGETGETIAGLSALAGVALCVTGLIIWLPTIRMFSWRVWPASLARRDLVASHGNLGAIIALPVIFLTLTGASFVFQDQTRWVLAKVLPSQALPKPPDVTPPSASNEIDWTSVLVNAQSAFPNATLRLVIWPKKPTSPIAIRLRQPGEWNPNGRTLVWLDPSSSQIVGTLDALALKPAQATYNLIYPLHAAKMGEGLLGRLIDAINALTGLALAGLGLIGAVSFFKKLRRTNVRKAVSS